MMVFFIGLTVLSFMPRLGRASSRGLEVSKYRDQNKHGRPGRNAGPAIHATAFVYHRHGGITCADRGDRSVRDTFQRSSVSDNRAACAAGSPFATNRGG